MRAIKLGLLVLAIASPAFGREHYIEVWNPPEARGGVAPSQAALLAARKADRQAARHRRASLHIAHDAAHDVSHSAAHRRTVAAAPAPQAPVVTVERRTGEPRYEDIPRQITPEGNVLRIDGRHAQVDVER
ncbi:hypothetical protein GCM10027093_71980 [Paraburkholderia jirisanensis]